MIETKFYYEPLMGLKLVFFLKTKLKLMLILVSKLRSEQSWPSNIYNKGQWSLNPNIVQGIKHYVVDIARCFLKGGWCPWHGLQLVYLYISNLFFF